MTVANRMTVRDSRKDIKGKIMDYLTTPDPAHMLLIKAAAGVGKTWLGVAAADWVATNLDRKVLYTGSRHDFFFDIQESVSGQGLNNAMWYEWLPRQSVGEKADPTHTCLYTESINAWLHRGYDGQDFCKAACGWAYIGGGCKYHAQKKRDEMIIYGQHQHVTLGHPMMSQFYCVIGDENPMGAFINKWVVPAKYIYRSEMGFEEPLLEILSEMQDLCGEQILKGPALLEKLGGAQRVFDACDLYSAPPAVYIPHVDAKNEAEVKSLPYHYLPVFVPLLKREAEAALRGEAYLERIYLTEHGLVMACRNHAIDKLPKHVIWFDATGNAEVYEKLFERDVVVVDARPDMVGRVIQITDKSNGKSAMMPSEGDELDPKSDKTLSFVKYLCRQHSSPAIITFKTLKEYYAKHTGVPVMHFYANRGSNLLENSDAVIVIGAPQPAITEMIEIAKCLWYGRMEPFDAEWVQSRRAYKYVDGDGVSWEYAVGEYKDHILNLILTQSRESELVQAANRARIVTKANTVYLLTNIPIDDLPPTRLTNMREFVKAPEGIDAARWIEFLAVVDRIEAEHGVVRLSDLVSSASISVSVATHMMDALVQGGEWEPAIVRRGAGTRALTRKTR